MGGGRRGPPPSAAGRRSTALGGRAGGLVLAGTLLGAVMLLVAEFTTLYQVHVATSPVPTATVTSGTNHSYALVPLALLAAALGVAVWRSESRSALLAIGVIGLVAMLIALLGDLPDSHATGLSGSATSGYVNANATPSAGLYLETLGAILLIATSGLGFIFIGPPRRRRRGRDRPKTAAE